MFEKNYDIVIIGAGILGISIGYFLALNTRSKIAIIEQENDVALHSSSRNTGKVHAPFLYDPHKKKFFAKSCSLGYDMWKKYTESKNLSFKEDGVIEIAKKDQDLETLNKYYKWGLENGLKEKEIEIVEGKKINEIEPNIVCKAALLCKKDASVNYHKLSKSLEQDNKKLGNQIFLSNKVIELTRKENKDIKNTKIKIIDSVTNNIINISCDFLINAGGGNSLKIANSMNIATEFINLHFKGEYWIAPSEYNNLTKHSIYSVPKNSKFPFLDPHWIKRVNGICEIGPNAVPVLSYDSYGVKKNIKNIIPKIGSIILKENFWKISTNKEFMKLVFSELESSLIKDKMIDRVKDFLPKIDSRKFKNKGIAGIRSPLINRKGEFAPDTIIRKTENSLHILNYNSPGATGALPISAMIVQDLLMDSTVTREKNQDEKYNIKEIWNVEEIHKKIKSN